MKNVPASVFQRLHNLARERGEDVNALLALYAVERLLDRVSRSSHAERFVLKGAMLFRVWTGALHRPTRDVDLLGYGDPDPDWLAEVFSVMLRETIDGSDGVVYDYGAVRAEEIRDAQEYGGVRVRIPATLGTARTVVQVDVGFGDAITPGAEAREFPTLLGHAAPRILIYPPETAVAEKLEAICSIGLANSRMKDYYDLLVMSRRFGFDGATLARAVASTFERRATPIPLTDPVGLTDVFAENEEKQKQWAAFRDRTRLPDAPAELRDVVRAVRAFADPPRRAASSGAVMSARWHAGEGWNAGG